MQCLDLRAFEEQAADFDRLVEKTSGVDGFCSSTDWCLPANEALMPEREPWLWRSDAGYVAMMKGLHPDGFTYVQPMEGMWLLGSPFAMADEGVFVGDLCRLFKQQVDWDVMMLAGMEHETAWVRRLLGLLAVDFKVYRGPSTVRIGASLGGGLEHFLGQRTRYFRRNLKRNITRCEEQHIRFERLSLDSPEQISSAFQRMMAVEAESWKGLSGAGVNEGAMRDFYTLMLPRLARRGAARLIMATQEGEDAGFIFGGIRLHTYRGLQFSFKDVFRPLGLGNVLQYETLKDLCSEGIEMYDLGTDIEYKRLWGTPYLTTTMFTLTNF
jgi:hypothetical protein